MGRPPYWDNEFGSSCAVKVGRFPTFATVERDLREREAVWRRSGHAVAAAKQGGIHDPRDRHCAIPMTPHATRAPAAPVG